MTIEEQKRIAYDQGRLDTWNGHVHKEPAFRLNPVLMKEWSRGVADQSQVMREAAARIPLTWSDQIKSGAHAD